MVLTTVEWQIGRCKLTTKIIKLNIRHKLSKKQSNLFKLSQSKSWIVKLIILSVIQLHVYQNISKCLPLDTIDLARQLWDIYNSVKSVTRIE